MRAALLSALTSVALAQTPIPNRPDGVVFKGNYDAHVVIDVFVDLMCPDSRTIYPVMNELAANYNDTDVQLKYHIFPLPFHRNAYLTAQGAAAVYNQGGQTALIELLDYFYADGTQEMFINSATTGMTTGQTISAMGAGVAGAVTGFSEADWAAGLSDPNDDYAARVSWKYACSKGVSGTPWWFVNDVTLQADYSWTIADWESIINPLLAASQTAALTLESRS